MRVLENLDPERVFYYFEELTRIPHASRNTKEISDYLVKFGKELGLEVRQDEADNVIIKKPAHPACRSGKTLMLQGHIDMVAAKTADSSHDFAKDPLKLSVKDGWVWADRTTLGADDGIGAAMCMAALADKEHVMPALECVFTSDEEIGMLGAAAIDLSDCKADYLINLDSEEEGVFTVSCAGGVRAALHAPCARIGEAGVLASVVVDGGLGGHSGMNIADNRGNMIKILAAVLKRMSEKLPLGLVEFEGGMVDNAICAACHAVIVVPFAEKEEVKALWEEAVEETKAVLPPLKGNISYRMSILSHEADEDMVSPEDTKRVLDLIEELPDGVQKMSEDVPGMPETSLNLGVARLSGEEMFLDFCLRSSDDSQKMALLQRLLDQITAYGGTYEVSGLYSGWKYDPDSALRQMASKVYEEMYGVAPKIEMIHAGLECGMFKEKMPDLDIIALGVNMLDIHSPMEHLSVESTAHVWDYLLKLMARIAE